MSSETTSHQRDGRFTVEVVHEPLVAPTSAWAELKHKSPFYGSQFRFDFTILRTDVEREESLKYAVTQYVEVKDCEEEEVLNWLDGQASVVEATVA